jgi:tetratricopeptide (TPR) repeat protein
MRASAPSYPVFGRTGTFLCLTIIVGAAAWMGWPTLEAGYLSGDDEALIFNHGLVNRPSLSHAAKLFEVVHRDLYQPLPLLSFQAEFALHASGSGPHHIQHICSRMHLTNLLIHALNAVLVVLLFKRLTTNAAVTAFVALAFVAHPLSTECYAWLNGRMIMMSATFSLLTLLLYDIWMVRARCSGDRPHRPAHYLLAAGVLLALALAMMSKLRLGLPVLLLLMTWWRMRDGSVERSLLRCRSWWACAVLAGLLTGVFLWINVASTGDSRMFEGARHQLQGPNGARVALALGWYIQHYFWPVGLSPWYAAPQAVAWGDADVLWSVAIVLVALGVVWTMRRRWPEVVPGSVWFLVTVASTLPFIPARNLLVADRYVYLSNIGLHWIVGAALWWCIERSVAHKRRFPTWMISATAVMIAWGSVSRGVTSYYRDDDAKIRRMVDIAPDYPTLLTSWGWYFYRRGDYAGAITKANEELARFSNDDAAYYRALNLRAVASFKMNGDLAPAESDLRAAIERGPGFAKSYYRLGMVLDKSGRAEEAEPHLLKAIELAPGFNPAIKLRARICRRKGRIAKARALYEEVVVNSVGYDLEAQQALCEIAMETEDYERAIQRYRQLLDWLPDHVDLRINLAFALHRSGQSAEAIDQYTSAVEIAPHSGPARMNLAILLDSMGQAAAAREQFLELIRRHPTHKAALIAAARALRAARQYGHAAAIWGPALASDPNDAELWALRAYHECLAGLSTAEASASAALGIQAEQPLAELVMILAQVQSRKIDGIFASSQRIVSGRWPVGTYEYAYEALEFLAKVDPRSPWPYYVTAVLLHAEGRDGPADVVRQQFEQTCTDPKAHQQLRARLANGRSEENPNP